MQFIKMTRIQQVIDVVFHCVTVIITKKTMFASYVQKMFTI